MQTSIRIISGTLRGRKVLCNVTEELRPTPQMVREAFFSTMGNAIPDRVFIDVFAGTGVIAMEALSRGATTAFLIERDLRLSQAIEKHLREFDLMRRAKLFRTDAYRWLAAWIPPKEPVNVFLSPPFIDLTEKSEDLLQSLRILQAKVPEDSIIVLQSEVGSPLEEIEELKTWETRKYGRNLLMLWQREITSPAPTEPEANTNAANHEGH